MSHSPNRPNPEPIPVTVVAADGRAALALARRLAARSPGPSIDRPVAGEPILPATIALAAEAVAAERTGVEGDSPQREMLLERAAWCEQQDAVAESLADEVVALDAEIEAATARAAEAKARVVAVAEQRAAADAVLEQAHKQLLELDVAGQSENDVRRTLESTNLAARQAKGDADAARQRAEDLALALLDAKARRAAIDAERTSLQEVSSTDAAPVAAALQRAETAPLVAPDPATLALADDLERRATLLAELPTPGPGVAPGDLDAAEAAVGAARLTLEERRRPPTNDPPPWWNQLAVLHAAVVDAEVAAGATLARPSARKRLEGALAAERAFLADLGFDSHLDALLTGGRPGPRLDPQAIPEAERALADAEAHLATLRVADATNAAYRRARADLLRVRALAGALLGVPSEAATAELLRRPRPDPAAIAELAAALAQAGAAATDHTPLDHTLIDRARAWLAASATVANRLEVLAAERTEILERYRTLAPQAEAATAEAEARASAAKTARRKVEVLESELANRVRPVVDPTVRAATAAALRDRIGALEARMSAARLEADSAHQEATAALSQVTARADEARRRLEALARTAAAAVALLPDAHDGANGLMTDLGALAAALRAEAGHAGPADHAVALQRLLDPVHRSSDVVLDPVLGLPADIGTAALDALIAVGGERPVVVVTTDPRVVSWARGLPDEAAIVVSTDALDLGPSIADEPPDPLTDRDHATAHTPPPTR